MQFSASLIENRRRFLRLLAGSPLLGASALLGSELIDLLSCKPLEAKSAFQSAEVEKIAGLISSPDQAFDVMDFEQVARKVLPPAHFGYLATGVDDDATIRANREGFSKFQIRSRRLVDVEHIDMSVRLFDNVWDSPIVLAPVGAQKAFHPEGELAVAKAARAKGHLQILSTASSTRVEDVIAARGAPVWFQLYAVNDFDVVRGMLKRAEAAGCRVMAVTLDLQDGSNRETLFRAQRADSRQCTSCHGNSVGTINNLHRRPIFEGLDVSKVTELTSRTITWDFIKRLKDTTSMKVMLKGIVTREDAELAVANGADGVIVSNHGGRAEETLRSTIESLPEVLEGAAGRIPVLVDGGFRRGTDVFKALALGARAICIGRPYIWGLASFGQPGVETVLTILRRELQIMMRAAGTPSIAQITRASVVDRSH